MSLIMSYILNHQNDLNMHSEKEIKGVSRSGGLELVGDKVQAYQEAGDEEDDE